VPSETFKLIVVVLMHVRDRTATRERGHDVLSGSLRCHCLLTWPIYAAPVRHTREQREAMCVVRIAVQLSRFFILSASSTLILRQSHGLLHCVFKKTIASAADTMIFHSVRREIYSCMDGWFRTKSSSRNSTGDRR